MRYHILDTHDDFDQARKDIDLVLRLMNERFTWAHGPLTLTWSATTTARDSGPRIAVVASGEIIVADDRWSAMLVVRFLLWVSRRLPQSFVHWRRALSDPLGRRDVTHLTLQRGVPQARAAAGS